MSDSSEHDDPILAMADELAKRINQPTIIPPLPALSLKVGILERFLVNGCPEELAHQLTELKNWIERVDEIRKEADYD